MNEELAALLDSDPVAVPLEYVLEREGVRLEEETRGELRYWCPFHAGATRATLALWKYNGVEYVRCFSCGFGPVSLVGYLRESNGVGFGEALSLVRKYARDLPADWTPTQLPSRRERTKTKNFQAEVEVASSGDKSAARAFLKRRGLGDLADWLIDQFRLGGDRKWIAVPHFTPDGQFPTAMKYRTLEGELRTMTDGVLSFLYGAWRDPGAGAVVVAEGESDTWRIAAWIERRKLNAVAVGLPHGACGPKLHWTKWLRSRRTVVLFDGDEAGQAAAAKWLAELPTAVSVDPGDGRDASDLSDVELDSLLSNVL